NCAAPIHPCVTPAPTEASRSSPNAAARARSYPVLTFRWSSARDWFLLLLLMARDNAVSSLVKAAKLARADDKADSAFDRSRSAAARATSAASIMASAEAR